MFTEDNSDPVKNMGIGAVEYNGYAKGYSLEELEELYRRVHDNKGRVILKDGKFFDELGYREQISINNEIVGALNYYIKNDRKNKSRGLQLKEGDVIKVFFERSNEWIYGFPQFMKRGNVKTDGNGRVIATTKKGEMKVHADGVVICSKEEADAFKKEYRIKELTKSIEDLKWYMRNNKASILDAKLSLKDERYQDKYWQTHYKEIIKSYRNRVKEQKVKLAEELKELKDLKNNHL